MNLGDWKDQAVVFVWMGASLAVGMLMGSLGSVDEWYLRLSKPFFTPPNWIFPWVWTVLYLLLGFVGWKLWTNRSQSREFYALSAFSFQMLLNWSWSLVFFRFHLIGIALVVLASMITLTVLTMILSLQKHVKQILLLYLVWIVFACCTNYTLYLLNP